MLLKRLEDLAQQAGWLTSRIQLEPRHNREAPLAETIVGLAAQAQLRASRLERVKERLRTVARHTRAVQVAWEDLSFSFDPLAGEPQRGIARALVEAAGAAAKTGCAGYLVMLDEAQVLRDERDRDGEHPLSALVAAVNGLQDQQVPVGLVLCGLPTLRANLLRARTYSERMFRGEHIGALDGEAAGQAFLRPLEDTGVTASTDLADRVVDEVEGYPFFIQLWGAELWDAARDAGVDQLSSELLDGVEPDIYRRLDSDFYEPRVEALTPAEQDLLAAAARCPYPPLKTVDIRRRAGKSDSNVNVLMGRLAEQGVVYRIQKGLYEYTAPKFHAYLRRRYP